MDLVWGDFSGKVQAAIDGGLAQLVGGIVMADTSIEPMIPLDPAEKAMIDGNNPKIQGNLEALVGGSVQVWTHSVDDSWKLSIEGEDNEIKADRDFI